MPVEMLTYADLAERLKITPEAARALAKRHRLPRSRSNDGKALVSVDLAEIQHKPLPARSPAGDRVDAFAMKACIDSLQKELAKVETMMTELLKATAETMSAKESTARLEGELMALRSSRPWWKWIAG